MINMSEERFYLDKRENYPYIPRAIAIIYQHIWQNPEEGIKETRLHLEKCGLLTQGENSGR